ncbi:MAG: DNA repair protein [Gammaproteobacteria bacterium]
MSSGKFQLYRKDAAGNDVPCSGITYRIMSVMDGTLATFGITDENGYTATVVARAQQQQAGAGTPMPAAAMGGQGYRPAPLLPLHSNRYVLQVRDSITGKWIEPVLHPETRNAQLDLPVSSRTDNLPAAWALMQGATVKPLRLKPYHQFEFMMQQSRKRLPNAPYVAYTYDKDGRKVAAVDIDGKPIKGNTNRSGQTPRIYCEQKAWFVFNLPGTQAEFMSKAVEPVVSGAAVQLQQVTAKGQVAVSAPGKGKVADVSGKVSAPVILNAEDEELLLLTPDVWKEFEAVSGYIENTMAGVHRARQNLSDALQARSAEAIRQAEKDLGLAEDKVAKLLNKDFAKKADLVEVVTFESYDKGAHSGKVGADRVGMRRRYIPRKKYEQYKSRRLKGIPTKLEMSVSAKVKDGAASAKYEGKGERSDRKTFDAKKFRESLSKLKVQAKGSTQTDPWVWDMIDIGGNEFAETVKKSDSYSVDKAAQWMRCVAGAGASAEANWDPKKGTVSAQASANAQAKLVLFEGKWIHTWSIPSAKGWQMNYGGIDLGAIVFQLACELYGFVGAKASLTGAVGISIQGGKAKIVPQARDRTDSLAANYDERRGLPRADMGDPPPPGGAKSSRIVPAALNEAPPKDINGMSLTAEAFAGAEGGITPSGELQWLPPQQTKPVSFAKLSLDVAVSAGAGASAQLYIYYARGKFRIKASARLCWGVGAKGAVDFVVDAEGMAQFVQWVYYQLAHAGFKVLVYFARDAFAAFSQLLFLAISKNTKIGQELEATINAIQMALEGVMRSLEKAENRYKLVRSINSNPVWLVYATPETRGMLLYALTRHDWATHSNDLPEVQQKGWDTQVHYLNEHKQAILKIVKGVKLRQEWTNMFQHMSIDGSKLADDSKAEGDVLRFLNYGLSLAENLKGKVFNPINKDPTLQPEDVGNSYLEDYLKHRASLLGQFPKGYEVAQLDRLDGPDLLRLDGQESPMFAVIDPQYLWLDRDAAATLLAQEHGRDPEGEGSALA